MNRQIYALIALVLILNFIVCGPPKPSGESFDCYPENLEIDINSETMDISWVNNCQQSIAGYNIYISEESLVGKDLSSVKPHNNGSYPGDTNPDDGVEHYKAEKLENGKKYFVLVRIINPGQTLSRPTSEKIVVCGARGEIELSIRFKSSHDGYSFEKHDYVKADNMENDLYFYSKDGKDYLNSPLKLDAYLKANKLKKLNGTGNLYDIIKTIKADARPDKDRVEVKKGDWLWLMTADDKSALVKVLEISGDGSDRKIKLYFAYSPLSGELIF